MLSAPEVLQGLDACQFPSRSGHRAVSTVSQNPAIFMASAPERFTILLEKQSIADSL
jgi:hypothetical protein